MTDKHEPEIPLALEAVATRLRELEAGFGPQAAQVLEHVQAAVIAAMAARDHGDRAAAFEHVAQAMRRLASLADGLDPAEAGRMRAAVESFRGALLHGSEGEAKQRAAVMFEKSGAVQKKRDT